MNALYPSLFSLVAAALLVRLVAKSRFSLGAMDVPNERSLHAIPVPRTGGIGLLGAALAGLAVFGDGAYGGLLALTGLLSAVTFADDRIGLPIRTRLFAQIAAAAAFLALSFAGPALLLPLAFGALLWMANLYNFMDGSDGLAGGMTVFGFGTYALAASGSEAPELAVLAACVAGAAVGFLVWNFHKASVFMGDSGSVPIGFLAGATGILGWQSGIWPFWFPALVFSPFIADATVTLTKRYRNGERLTQAHKTHYYQRALRMGLGHRGTAIAGYILMAATGASALAAIDWGPLEVSLLLAGWAAVFASLMAAIDRRWDLFSRAAVETGA